MARWSKTLGRGTGESTAFCRRLLPKSAAFLFAVLAVTFAACGQPSTPPAQTCPSPPPVQMGPNALETYAAHADEIVVGTVGVGGPEVPAGRSFYRDWGLSVEQYVTEPLPYNDLSVRTFTGALDAAGNAMPVKSPSLVQGQRVLLFLDKDWEDPPLSTDEFTIVDLFGGAFQIRDGVVNIRYFDEPENYAAKELEEVLNRIAGILKICS